MVEAQHTASTMKLVDSGDEQDVLEDLLEGSKPNPPKTQATYNFLLTTPFRYSPLRSGSRFRAVNDPGVFYGAESVHTASAELGYWRWRFLRDAVDLEKLDPVAHTAFSVEVATKAVDLREPPFDRQSEIWMHPTDYGPTQEFGRVARQAKVGAIVYRSVRDSDRGWCAAVLTLAAFPKRTIKAETQTWWLAVRHNQVTWRRNSESKTFSYKHNP